MNYLNFESEAILNYLVKPIDSASIALFRILFGLVMGWHYIIFIAKNAVYIQFIFTKYFFSYIDFVKPLPGNGMYYIFYALILIAILFSLGCAYHIVAILFFGLNLYVFLIDKTEYLNHSYLIVLLNFLFIFIPANRLWSIDKFFFGAKWPDTVPNWTILLLRFQFFIVYFFGGIAKLNYDWLHAHPIKEWLSEISKTANLPFLEKSKWAPWLIAYGGIFIDLICPILICFKRTFFVGAFILCVFHCLNSRLFSIDVFPYLMMVSLALFPRPDWPKLTFYKIKNRLFKSYSTNIINNDLISINNNEKSFFTSDLLIVFIGFYVLIQLFLPLRRFLYPGNVSWTEYGHRYSWSMMLRQKYGNITMYEINPITKEIRPIDLYKYLTYRQAVRMSTRPDMIIQFAKDYARSRQLITGIRPIIKVEAMASLNGRPYQYLIDPNVDLAIQKNPILPVPWILPLKDKP